MPTDPNLRVLALATLVNTVGNGAMMTTFALYFTRVVHLRPAQVGLALSLAALAGVVGGSTFVTEPQMAAALGPVVFVVVVVGGVGSLAGAFLASLLIGVLQTFAVGADASLADALAQLGLGRLAAGADAASLLHLSVSQLAPLLPYLLLIAVLVLRPRGLLGAREA